MTVSLSWTCTRRAGAKCWRPKSRVTSSCAPPELEAPGPKPQPPRDSASAASATAAAPATPLPTLVRRTHLHLEPVGPDRARRVPLEAVRARRREAQLHVALLAGLVSADDRALERLTGLAVDHGERDLPAGGRRVRPAQLELGMAERVERDQHVVTLVDALLAAAGLGVLVVEGLAPVAVVLRVARIGADPVDVEVLEALEPRGVPRDPGLATSVVEGREQGRTGCRVRAGVGAVALVRAAAVVAVELVSVRLHPAVEERLRLSFDAHVDGDGRVVRVRGRDCERIRDGEDREAQEPSSHWISLPFREG